MISYADLDSRTLLQLSVLISREPIFKLILFWEFVSYTDNILSVVEKIVWFMEQQQTANRPFDFPLI